MHILLILLLISINYSYILNKSYFRQSNILFNSNLNEINDNSENKLYVILTNIQSGSNIGHICRNALAFNVNEVIIIGRNSHLEKMRKADRGAHTRLKFHNVLTMNDARDYLINNCNCKEILGVEIHPNALPINTYQFHGSTAFMFGNEGGGLSIKQRDICDRYVYIPQFASSGMASINVACASSIIFYSFAISNNFKESTRLNEKFI